MKMKIDGNKQIFAEKEELKTLLKASDILWELYENCVDEKKHPLVIDHMLHFSIQFNKLVDMLSKNGKGV